MAIFITGDTHGDIDFHKLNSKNFPTGRTLTKQDYVIICGDFGGVWDGGKYDRYIQRWYANKPWTTLFVDGNHENHDVLDTYPVTIWNGGKVHIIKPNLIHLMRGQVYNIDGCIFFTMGGAQSHDKEYRKEGISWWPREMPSDEEYQEALNNLAKVHNCVDYIITHCAPDHIQNQFGYYMEHDKLTNFLKVVSLTTTFKGWFFGHYHMSLNIDDKFTALYHTIIQLK